MRASRFVARSPCSATPHIRFLFVGSRVSLAASFSTALADQHLAIRSGRYDQLPRGLAPPSSSPCRAHTKEPSLPGCAGGTVLCERRIRGSGTGARPRCPHPSRGGRRELHPPAHHALPSPITGEEITS